MDYENSEQSSRYVPKVAQRAAQVYPWTAHRANLEMWVNAGEGRSENWVEGAHTIESQ